MRPLEDERAKQLVQILSTYLDFHLFEFDQGLLEIVKVLAQEYSFRLHSEILDQLQLRYMDRIIELKLSGRDYQRDFAFFRDVVSERVKLGLRLFAETPEFFFHTLDFVLRVNQAQFNLAELNTLCETVTEQFRGGPQERAAAALVLYLEQLEEL